MIEHGGNLTEAMVRFGRTRDAWLDLSTGISPWTYPVTSIPSSVWQRLPDENDKLLLSAQNYYATPADCIVPVPGSQYAIKRIPQLIPTCTVAIPAVAYREHEHCWRTAGHTVMLYSSDKELTRLVQKGIVSHVIVINPNNPTTTLFDKSFLYQLSQWLPKHGVLIVDEAFMDHDRAQSMLPDIDEPRIVVLRSLGKFFGLAGIRLGFIISRHPLARIIEHELLPWGVNHPARWIAQQALVDSRWIAEQHQRIDHQSTQLMNLLQRLEFGGLHTAGLFLTLFDRPTRLESLHQQAAHNAIWLRFQRIDTETAWLRIGLPGLQWSRLENFLTHL